MPSTGRGSVDEWFAAIAVDDVETVGRMIFAGFDPATLPREDVPPYAPEYQSFAQPNGLWHAAKAGAINCLRELLRAGLDPTDSFFGESALMAARAAPKNGSAIVEAFIEAAGDKAGELIDRPWRYMSPGSKSRGNGQTAAMLFAQANKVDALEALIKAGAYIDGHDDLNRTIEDLSAMDCKEVIAAARANTVARPDSRAAEAWRETEGVLAAIGKRLSSSRGLRSIDPSSPTPSQRNRAPD